MHEGRHELLQRAGIEDLTIHDMRRSFGKRLESAGVPLVGIQKLLGHANITTTAMHYSPSGAGELKAWTAKAVTRPAK
jgi:integrase